MAVIRVVTPSLAKVILITSIFLKQNVRVLRIKCINFYDNVCPTKLKIICVAET